MTDLSAERDAVLAQLDDRTNQTWACKRQRWAALVRAQAAEIERLSAAPPAVPLASNISDESDGVPRARFTVGRAPEPTTDERPARADLIVALTFYADGLHFDKASPDAWDNTVSGEPQNWWCDEAGTATVEDGSVAKMTLNGELTAAQIQELEDGETLLDSTTPAPLAADQQEGGYYPPPEQTVSAYRALLDATPLAAEPLTDDEIDAICAPGRALRWKNDGRQYDRDTFRLAERAHGIGGGM